MASTWRRHYESTTVRASFAPAKNESRREMGRPWAIVCWLQSNTPVDIDTQQVVGSIAATLPMQHHFRSRARPRTRAACRRMDRCCISCPDKAPGSRTDETSLFSWFGGSRSTQDCSSSKQHRHAMHYSTPYIALRYGPTVNQLKSLGTQKCSLKVDGPGWHTTKS
jgi:hypothetical protein